MENLACIVVVFAAYCVWACAKYHGVPFSRTPDTIAPVDHFPTVEEVKELAIAAPQQKPIVESMPMPQATFTAPKASIKTAPKSVAPDLNSLSIRSLKKLASAAKIKRYSTKTKSELIACLS